MPRLTLSMVKRLQGFPDDWQVVGGKTSAYRQLGNAFPPAVAYAVARRIRKAIVKGEKKRALQLDRRTKPVLNARVR